MGFSCSRARHSQRLLLVGPTDRSGSIFRVEGPLTGTVISARSNPSNEAHGKGRSQARMTQNQAALLTDNALRRSNYVAFGYAIIGIGFVLMFGMLMWVSDPRSISDLWLTLRAAADTIGLLAVLAAIHLLMAAWSYRYVHRSALTRAAAMSLAVGLFGVALYGAVAVAFAWYGDRLSTELPQGAAALALGRPFAYGILAFEVCRLWWTSRVRVERMSEQ